MKYLIPFLSLILIAQPVKAIDCEATPESVWRAKFGALPGFPVTETALRTAIEWRTFNGPIPKISGATHYGLHLKRWERLFKHFGFAAVADDYEKFLNELKAELAQGNQS